MLHAITLKNFKLFREATEIPLSNLNLLTGINGRGKSTVMQSLLLMHQSPEHDRTTSKIVFNGNDVHLGSYKDVKNTAVSPSDPIELTFQYSDFEIKYRIVQNENDPMVGDIRQIALQGKIRDEIVSLKLEYTGGAFLVFLNDESTALSTQIFLHNLFITPTELESAIGAPATANIIANLNFIKVHYVAADRQGPKLFYPEKSLKDFCSVGALGEETVNVLYHKKSESIEQSFIENIAKLFHVPAEEIGQDVDLQTTFWLSQLFGEVQYQIRQVEDANLLTLSFSPEGTYYKPTNVGYGFTYVLPIIVSGLIAKEGELLLVENPEAHLHPHAQSVLAKFLTLVSMRGVQVIIESHSEHVLNGLRIPVYDRLIPNTHLNVLYFDRDQEGHFSKIAISEEGGIANWPPDFFDQATRDLNYLFGV